MHLSGEHHIKSTPAKIRRHFEDPEKLRYSLPDVISSQALGEGKTLVKFNSRQTEGLLVSYVFHVKPGESDKEFTISWQGLEPHAIFSNAVMHCTLRPERGYTVLSFDAEVDFEAEDHYLSDKPDNLIRSITHLLEQVADNLAKEERHMTDRKSDLDNAINKAEDAVLELEQEAEEAAAKGFLGGAQMWGWIALAVLIVILLVVF